MAERRQSSRVHARVHTSSRAALDAHTTSREQASQERQRELAARAAILDADRDLRAAEAQRADDEAAHSATRRPDGEAATGSEPRTEDAAAARGYARDLGRESQDEDDSAHGDRLMGLKSVQEEATTPVLLPGLRVASLYDSRGHLILPPPLYGSRAILLHQNEMADRAGLVRVRNDAQLLTLRREHKLVALPASEALRIDDRLPENRRYSRPWTADFLSVLADNFYAAFHQPLQVNSAVRTVQFQEHLERINGNAAPATGDTASPHLTGEAVDIAKHGLTLTEIAWMRTYLKPLIAAGKIDVEEEFQQACFHISVYHSYLPTATTSVNLASAR